MDSALPAGRTSGPLQCNELGLLTVKGPSRRLLTLSGSLKWDGLSPSLQEGLRSIIRGPIGPQSIILRPGLKFCMDERNILWKAHDFLAYVRQSLTTQTRFRPRDAGTGPGPVSTL